MNAARLVALMSAVSIALSGCGGGGDGVATEPAPPPGTAPGPAPAPGTQVNTYGATNLPGHLVVADADVATRAFDLRTGTSAAVADTASGKGYVPSINPARVLRVTPVQGGAQVQRIRTSDWSAEGSAVTIPGTLVTPKLSHDGKYLLTFWRPAGTSTGDVLVIFNAETGDEVKRGSTLNNELILANPADWLPNGNYVYLAGRTLYESRPDQLGAAVKATLTNLPPTDASDPTEFWSGIANLTVSPDGSKVAFDWREYRPGRGNPDRHVWVANIDGTDLHSVTAAADPDDALSYTFQSQVWSPDSQWLAFEVNIAGGALVLPQNTSYPDLGDMVTTTACRTAPVYVLPANAVKAAPTRPVIDTRYALKVRNPGGSGGAWVTGCGPRLWTP